MSTETSQIIQFFKNQTILLIGGTDFLGTLLSEKLLQTCDLKKIYVLVPKSQNSNFLDPFKCFQEIKNEKVSLIGSNSNKPLLGISPDDIEVLKKETTIVLHAGTGLKFGGTVQDVVTMINAGCYLLDLVKILPNLKIFVYTSSAYCSVASSHLKEEFYEPPLKGATVRSFLSSADDPNFQKYTNNILKKVSTYVYLYVRSVIEDLIKNSDLGAPTALIRPSNVLNTRVDDDYSLIGLAIKNPFHIKNISKNKKIHLVPADFLVNCILAITWKTAQKKLNSVTIYNCVGQEVPTEKFIQILETKFDMDKWYKYIQESDIWQTIQFYLGMILALVVDSTLLCFGKSSHNVEKYTRLKNALDHYFYIFRQEWVFEETNLLEVLKEMSDNDKQLFNFQMNIDWRTCFSDSSFYLMKDRINIGSDGERKSKMLARHYVVLISVFYCLYLFISFIMKFLTTLL